jgi:NADH-quinone oxidoreductase subunit N
MKALLIISCLGIIAMLAEVFKFRRALFPIVLLGIVAALVCNYMEWQSGTVSWFSNMIHFDKKAIAFSGVILITALLWFVLANSYFEEDATVSDHFALVLFTLVGALMLTAFQNMTTLFLGIEIMSIPLYVLAASKKRDIKSNEAGFKYLIMGSFASAFLLFGIALVYGATGSFDLAKIRTAVGAGTEHPLFLYTGVIMILMAMCFKVSAAPFHFWTPDVYEGSPTLITAMMSTVVKTAAFAAILRLFMISFEPVGNVWGTMLQLVIALSLVIANFTAAMQTSVKRMLAYSSISHAAFMLMVLLANVRNNLSLDALIYYSFAYSMGSIAAFGILYYVSRRGDESFDAFNGLYRKNPWMAFCMAIAMLSLAGIPITAGFFAKYFVFAAVINTSFKWLLILGVITSAVAVYYYLKVIIAMYFREGHGEPVHFATSGKIVIGLSIILTLALGIVPGVITKLFTF